MHPAPGVTFYIGRIDYDGTLNDVFLSDRRDPEKPVTYVGAQAFLVRNDEGANLVMLDGMAIRHDARENTLSTGLFEDFSFDASGFAKADQDLRRNIRAVSTWQLIVYGDQLKTEGSQGAIVEELHERFSWTAICLAVAMVGFSVLMMGGFSRFGLWPQVVVAFIILIALEGLRDPSGRLWCRTRPCGGLVHAIRARHHCPWCFCALPDVPCGARCAVPARRERPPAALPLRRDRLLERC